MPYSESEAADDTALRHLLLAMAQERSLSDLLGLITARLAALPEVALARIWLLREGDICPSCPAAASCSNRARCLHLVASAGRPCAEAADWSRLDGRFRRFPLGDRKIGRVALDNAGMTIADIRSNSPWIADPAWAAAEGIVGFVAKPLAAQDQVVGVLAVFTRVPLDKIMCQLAGILANHAAVSIANATAFAEVDRLRRALAAENELLRSELGAAGSSEIIGSSPAIQAVLERIALVAPTPASVLITGESGTGKELVAKELHRRSARADGPLVRVNCAAIPEGLFESEFFGHVRGAFTGATADRQGRFAAADDGTLFLDEIGEIPLALQGKLLRVLQEGTYERVGDERTRQVDVRVVAATNRDLQAEVAAGRFRADLYYRLNVVPIHLPPLRERREDIAAIALRLLARIALRFHRPEPALSRADLERLEAYSWPGNIRELANVLERALITGRAGRVALDLPSAETKPASRAQEPKRSQILSEREFQALEKANLRAALEQTSGRIFGPDGAALVLGLKPTTLISRLKRYGLRR